MRPIVYFFIEHKTREYETVARIAHLLDQKHSISSRILSIPFHSHYLMWLPPPDLMVVPFGMDEQDWPLRAILHRYDFKMPVLNMCWEQLLSDCNKDYKRPRGEFLLNHMRYIAWDVPFQDYLIKSGVDPSHISIASNPNVSLLAVKQRQYVHFNQQFRHQFGIAHDQTICFLPMNYAWAFISERTVQNRIDRGYDPDQAVAYHSFSKQSLERFLTVVVEIAKTYPELFIVLRPHPGVSVDQYLDAFDVPLPANIKVTTQGTVQDWVVVSDLVGSSWSTVVYDAFKFGKPAFLFQPFALPDWLDVDWMHDVPRFQDQSHFDAWYTSLALDQGCDAGERNDYFSSVADHIHFMVSSSDATALNVHAYGWSYRYRFLRFFIRALLMLLKIRNRNFLRDYFKAETIGSTK